MSANRRPTIKQVAAEAGVSTQTISRVINDRPDVSPETRERVQRVIDRLGYQPSAVARSLIGQRTYTIGVAGSGLEYFGPSRAVAGIERQAAELGFAVLLSLLHDPEKDDARAVLDDMLAHQVEGIIWAVPQIGDNHRWIREIHRPTLPMVFMTMEPQPDLAIVALDNRTAARRATEHLLAQGCRNVALVAGPPNWWEARQRQLGWRDALSAAHLAAESRQMAEGNWSAASGAAAFATLREHFPEMNGIFAANDQMAQGILHAAWSAGVRVPQELAVVGFDDIPEASYFIPPLTTIRQESTELGATAVRVLGRLIDAWQAHGHIATLESLSIQPQLIVRQSSIRQPQASPPSPARRTRRARAAGLNHGEHGEHGD